jgi:putative addiction module component (TIGR02574 family)
MDLRRTAMTDTVQAVAEAAMKLSAEDRELLVERLIASLDSGVALHPDWREEIARRLVELQAGRTRFIPADEAMARLAAHIHRRRLEA